MGHEVRANAQRRCGTRVCTREALEGSRVYVADLTYVLALLGVINGKAVLAIKHSILAQGVLKLDDDF